MILLCFSYSLVDGRQPSPGPCDPSSGPFLVRMNRPTTDGIGRMSSVLYFLRSESEQPLPAMRVGKRTTMPVGSRTGHRQNEPVRTRCDVPRSPTISIATQPLTGSHPEVRAHGGIPAFSHRPVEPPDIRSTGIRPGHAKCVRFCPSGQVLRRACNRYSPHSMPIATVSGRIKIPTGQDGYR